MSGYVDLYLTLLDSNYEEYEAHVHIDVTLGTFDQVINDSEDKEKAYLVAEAYTGWSREDGLTIFIGTQLSDETLVELFQWIDDSKTALLLEDGGTLPENRVHVFAVKDYTEAVRFKLKWIGNASRYNTTSSN